MAFKVDKNCKDQASEKYQLTTTLKVILLEFMCIFDETTSVNVSGTFLWLFYTKSVLNKSTVRKCISIHFNTFTYILLTYTPCKCAVRECIEMYQNTFYHSTSNVETTSRHQQEKKTIVYLI